jgi:hypothetical protein
MYIYYKNNIAAFPNSPKMEAGSYVENIYDPMLELPANFDVKGKVTIKGTFENIVAIDSVCIGNTNAFEYKLSTREGDFSGRVRDWINISNFDEPVFTDYFTLDLEGDEDEKLYLGYLFLGVKTVLPRFEIKPKTGLAIMSEAARSFGGQVLGMKRQPLESFGVNFARLTLDEYNLLKEYIKTVQTVEPHIIDPYHEARKQFPPMYATLTQGEYSFPKRDENGFYFTGSLSWQEAR